MDLSGRNFGVVISLLLPGYLLLWGLSYSVDGVDCLLAGSKSSDTTTIGGALYATLTSLSLGMLISAARWAIVDLFFQRVLGINTQGLEFSKLKQKDTYEAFQGVVEAHYRYYQFYSNSFVAILVVSAFYAFSGKHSFGCLLWGAAFLLLALLLFAALDCWKKYIQRAKAILG